MKTAPAPQKSRFSPVAVTIGVIAIAGLSAAGGYAVALATRFAPAPVVSAPVVEKAEPVVAKVEPKAVAKKVEPVVAVKKVWTFDEALAEAKAMAERLKDEDFEEAKKNLTRADYGEFFGSYSFLKEEKYDKFTSGVNNRIYSIATNIGMTNYFSKRIARWSFQDKYFPMFSEFAWAKVEVYRNPESILHSAVLYGYDLNKAEAVANTPTQGSQAINQTVKSFWEDFTGARWSDLAK